MSILIIGGSPASRLAEAKKIAPEALEISPKVVDEIRELKRIIATGISVIINDAQSLTPEAQNAFLKTLEEPPENTVIILLAENEDQLLPTVVSRCFVSHLGSPGHLGNPGDLEKLKTVTDRAEAIALIDEFLKKVSPCQGRTLPGLIRKLLQAKKYLKANTNVRLTLENLFLN